MFGSLGLSELFFLLLVGGGAMLFARRGALAISGPALVLRKFEVRADSAPAVTIEGRTSGFVAWLLTTIGLDTLTVLTVTDQQVSFRKASLNGEIHQLVPTSEVSSTHCGYSQPIWLLILACLVLVLSMLSAISTREGTAFIGGMLIAGVCGVIFLLQRKIAITIETTGGILMGLAFKPSVIEHVSVDLAQALQAVNRINGIVVAQSKGAVR